MNSCQTSNKYEDHLESVLLKISDWILAFAWVNYTKLNILTSNLKRNQISILLYYMHFIETKWIYSLIFKFINISNEFIVTGLSLSRWLFRKYSTFKVIFNTIFILYKFFSQSCLKHHIL